MPAPLLRTLLAFGALAAFPLAGCNPTWDEPQRIHDLRVLAVQVSPDTATFDSFPLPEVRVRALVVDPEDPDGDGLSHAWEADLGDEDFEGREALEAVVPDGPYGDAITLDFSELGARDGWTPSALPLRYTVQNAERDREALRLARFLVPPEDLQFEEWPDPTEHPDFNLNPTITALEHLSLDGEEVLERWEEPPGPEAPLEVGTVEDEGLRVRLELADDRDTLDLTVELFWTSGRAGLEGQEGLFYDDGDGRSGFGQGPSPVLGNPVHPREFGWTPAAEDPSAPPRLFFVIRDGDGGQTWQELRMERR